MEASQAHRTTCPTAHAQTILLKTTRTDCQHFTTGVVLIKYSNPHLLLEVVEEEFLPCISVDGGKLVGTQILLHETIHGT